MDDKLEIIYYQLIEMESRLDKKIEYIEKTENSMKKIYLDNEQILKTLKTLKEER